MSYLKQIEKDIIKAINNAGFDVDQVDLTTSNRPELGDYQINDAMKLAKAFHKNPREIAEAIKTELEKDYRFENINIAGPGFINLSISNKALIEFLNELNEDVKKNNRALLTYLLFYIIIYVSNRSLICFYLTNGKKC